MLSGSASVSRTLMKLSPGVNFINMLTNSFYTHKYSGDQFYFTRNTMLNFTSTFNYKFCPTFMLHTLSTLCAIKIIVYLLLQKLFVKWWSNLLLVSILSTFYKCLFCQYFCAKKLQSQNVTREKLHKALLYKNHVRKMMMKLNSGHLTFL